MADENLPPEEAAKRSVGRTIRRWVVTLVLLTGIGAWYAYGGGYYTLEPGQAAVLLFLGKKYDTVLEDGPHFTLPAPFVERIVVNTSKVHREGFGIRDTETEETPPDQVAEASMQTGDNNIVRVGFSVQYSEKDPFAARFQIAEPTEVLRDAAQAAVREVVGRMTVDRVLREGKQELVFEAKRVLQELLDSYDAGLRVSSIEAQNIQAPVAVADAFEDVLRATQNADQAVNEAQGYRNEILPAARAEAQELLSSAEGHRESSIAEATGQAQRFLAIAVEYRKAPEVTKKRLFIEAMEDILPPVEKVLIDGDSTPIMPYLPLERRAQQ